MLNKRTVDETIKKIAEKKDNLSIAQKIKLGAGIATTAIAAAGTYFLYGSKDAKQNRELVRDWASKAKAEVLETLEEAKHMTPEEYEALVKGVISSYSKLRDVTSSELKAFEEEMKDHWNQIEKSVKNPND